MRIDRQPMLGGPEHPTRQPALSRRTMRRSARGRGGTVPGFDAAARSRSLPMSGTDGRWSAAAAPVGPSRLATWHQEAFAAVERWKWLHVLNDRVSAVTQPLYDRYRGNLAVELMHGGRWAGHSVHAALSDLPIGLWAGALVLDTVGKDRSDDGSRRDPAATLSAAGLVAAVATAATGVTDWNVSDGEDRRVGLFHGLLNLAGTTLQAASLAARLGGHTPSARVLAATSIDRHRGCGVRRRASRAGQGGHGQPGGDDDRPHPVGPGGGRDRPGGRCVDRRGGRGQADPAAPRRRARARVGRSLQPRRGC